MADAVAEEIEDALQLIVSTAEQSVKMKKELKQTILDTVSTLRGMIVKMHVIRVSNADEINKLVNQVGELEAELKECRQRSAEIHGTPSSETNHEPAGKLARRVAPPRGRDDKPTKSDCDTGNRVAPPSGTKLYSEAVSSGKPKKLFQLTIKSTSNTTQEKVSEILKARITLNLPALNYFSLPRYGVFLAMAL